MTPIKTGALSAFQYEDFALAGGHTYRIYYLEDPNNGKWLSTHIESITLGRNATGVIGFIRTVNGIVVSAGYGPEILHKGTLIGVTARAKNTPLEMRIRVYNNSGIIDTIDWHNVSTIKVSKDVDFSVGNLSVDFTYTDPAHTRPEYPIVQLYVKWRL
jgi:hypothetical protein